LEQVNKFETSWKQVRKNRNTVGTRSKRVWNMFETSAQQVETSVKQA